MSLLAQVDSETLAVYYYYYTSGGIPNDVNDHCVRVPVPDGVDYTCAKAARADDGTISIIVDSERLLERQWAELREERNRRLAACDWTQLADSHLSVEKQMAWADYRQALRDVPDEVTDPTQVQWPAIPTVAVPVASGARVANLMEQI